MFVWLAPLTTPKLALLLIKPSNKLSSSHPELDSGLMHKQG